MTGVVVDTDVVSYLFKRDTRAALYAKHLAGRPLHVAFATIAELYRWAVFNGLGQPRIDALHVSLSKYGVLVYDAEMGNAESVGPSGPGLLNKDIEDTQEHI